ncbi:MAG: type II toxin-antitoxin system antitoxin DNA ADP-ribosyl glycohydrolase DarG [Acetobacteraceae bacterium]
MIRYTQGNLLEAGTDALVNTVNTVGVSGKGIALMFKERFPDNFRGYARACEAGRLDPGGLFVTERQDMLGPRFIINLATKQHWRYPSRLEWISRGLDALRGEIAARGIRSIAIPPLGAGNGGLDWHDVKPLIAEALTGLDCDIVVYEPTPVYQNVVKRHGVKRLTPARALMAEMIRRYEVLGFDCSMLEAQKLAWFLSGAIARLNLPNPIASDFQPDRYGPYSDQVRHLLDSLDGSYLTCERRVGDARPFDPIRFRYDRQDRVAACLGSSEASAYRCALDTASAIVDGFQSPHGLELLATIDWLHRRSGVPLEVDRMTAAIAAWPGPPGAAARKARVFSRHHIAAAVEQLRADPAPGH